VLTYIHKMLCLCACSGLSHLSHLYSSSTPRRVSVGSQAYVPASPQLISINTNNHTHNNTINSSTVGLSVDLSSSMELEEQEEELLEPADLEEEEPMGEEEEEELVEEEADSDLTASTINRETMAAVSPASAMAMANARRQPLRSQESQSQTATPVHYSSTNYSMSKQCMLNNANANSTETETDNIIYTDINDMGHYKYPDFHSAQMEHKISNSEHLNLNDRNDIYATVNRKTKSKTREKHFSDEFIDQSILQYTRAKQMGIQPPMIPMIQQPSTSAYAAAQERNYNSLNYQYHNDLNHPSESSSSSYFGTGFGTKRYAQNERVKLAQSENYLTPSIDSQSSRHTHSLPRNSELSGVDSVDSYDSHYITHHPRRSSGDKLEYQMTSGNLYSTAQFVKPEQAAVHYMDDDVEQDDDGEGENIYDQVERESWLKSSSCKDLFERYSSAYYAREQPKPMTAFDKEFLSSNRIDSPVTRYDDSRHSLYFIKNHSIDAHQDFSPLPHSKVYSSSYPGSTYNTQEHKRQYGQQLDFTGSQDDISQDSYELLEKYDIDFFSGRRRSEDHMRSCSLDSGNYIPSDDESVSEQPKYRSAIDVKSKSAADIMNEIWDAEDPRYLPREKLSVKSDGNFYKKIQEALTRTSSQESQSEMFETKISRSSDSSKKSRDSLYHTDSKKSRETTKSKTSVASSQDSKESLVGDCFGRNYEMPTTTGKKVKQFNKKELCEKFAQSSQDSKSDYYDAVEPVPDAEGLYTRPKVKSHDCLLSDTHSSTALGLCDDQLVSHWENSFKYRFYTLYILYVCLIYLYCRKRYLKY